MKKLSSKSLKEHSFVLYDLNDSVLYYFENYKELSKHINIPSRNLATRYNINHSDLIRIVFDGMLCKLYIFD